MTKEIAYLQEKALVLRRDIIEMSYSCGRAAHPAPALSCADIAAALFFKFMRVDAAKPDWEDRDRFILSKGHASPILYAALGELGFFDKSVYKDLRHPDCILQGHPVYLKTPGVDMTAGSLGNGLGIGLGMAYYLKQKKKKNHVYVILGDGELNEGTVWEGVMLAPTLRLDNLIVYVDYNHFQSCGTCEDILPMGNIADKWKPFGWNVLEINGHSMEEIVSRTQIAVNFHGMPTVIIAHTIKGKGVSFMEHDNSWHQKKLTKQQYEQAMTELKEAASCQ